MAIDLSGFTMATAISAEGARVAAISCKRCGCALLLDSRESLSVVDRHRAWHEQIDRLTGEPGQLGEPGEPG